jgi:prepilin-type N-terminal cleavage/methylation domain-containing protein
VIPFRKNKRPAAAFSLIEMVAVIAILATLMTAGVSLLSGTGLQSRKTGTDMLSGLIEQARTKAITSRSNVLLVIAEPGTLPAQDERCRIGMFKVPDNWLDNPDNVQNAELLTRWQTLNTGIVLIPGDVELNNTKVPNPIGTNKKMSITYGGTKNLKVSVYAIAFNSRGGLAYPTGSTPIVLRIAEGGYRGGEAKPNKRGDSGTITENRLRIGRVTARPYQIDG